MKSRLQRSLLAALFLSHAGASRWPHISTASTCLSFRMDSPCASQVAGSRGCLHRRYAWTCAQRVPLDAILPAEFDSCCIQFEKLSVPVLLHDWLHPISLDCRIYRLRSRFIETGSECSFFHGECVFDESHYAGSSTEIVCMWSSKAGP